MGIRSCETCRHLEYEDGKYSCELNLELGEDMWDKDCMDYYFEGSYP